MSKTILIAVIAVVFILFLGAYKANYEVMAPGSGLGDDSVNETTDTASAVMGDVEVYDGITVARSVTELDLSGRALTGSLKAEIRELKNLTVLNISNNNFTGLPAEVGQLTNLTVLSLSNNPLTGLPHELGNLTNLQLLDLRGTNYSEIDLEIITALLSDDIEILK